MAGTAVRSSPDTLETSLHLVRWNVLGQMIRVQMKGSWPALSPYSWTHSVARWKAQNDVWLKRLLKIHQAHEQKRVSWVFPLLDILQTGESEPLLHFHFPSLGFWPHQLVQHPFLFNWSCHLQNFPFWYMLFEVGYLLVPTHLIYHLFPELGPWWVCVQRKADIQHCGLAAGTEIQCRVAWISGLDF